MRSNLYMNPIGRVAAATTALVLLSAGTAHAAGSDEAAGAHKFRDLPFSDSTDASTATANASDPSTSCFSDPPTASVWYRFQPKSTGTVTIDTFGSGYDTVLAVFTSSPGQSAQNLTEVTCNDDTFGLQSEVHFTATRNTTYFIMVDTFASSSAGALVLNAH